MRVYCGPLMRKTHHDRADLEAPGVDRSCHLTQITATSPLDSGGDRSGEALLGVYEIHHLVGPADGILIGNIHTTPF